MINKKQTNQKIISCGNNDTKKEVKPDDGLEGTGERAPGRSLRVPGEGTVGLRPDTDHLVSLLPASASSHQLSTIIPCTCPGHVKGYTRPQKPIPLPPAVLPSYTEGETARKRRGPWNQVAAKLGRVGHPGVGSLS